MGDSEQDDRRPELVELSVDRPVWENFFTVAPLILVGTMEEDGGHDLAPKHMATPVGWDNYFCFVCSPSHATQNNAQRTGEFTVSFPRPGQEIEATMAAGPRESDGDKPTLAAIPTFPAREVEGVLVSNSYLWLECRLDKVVEGYANNSLIIGEIVAAAVSPGAHRSADVDDADLLVEEPLLAYISPGRFTRISDTNAFPFPADFKR